MNLTSVAGIGGAFLCVVAAAGHAGLGVQTFVNLEAFILVFGGTFFATITSVGTKEIKNVPTYLRLVFTNQHETALEDEIRDLMTFAEKARREGLLSLEDNIQEMPQGTARQILTMVVDGTEPDIIQKVMETEVHAMEERHKRGIDLFNTAGGYAPTMGIIGTVMGVVVVLANLGTGGMEELGKGVALAFIVTFFGIALANMFLLPMAGKLKFKSEEEIFRMRLMFEGFRSLQQGENSHVVLFRLNAFLESRQRLSREFGKE